MIIWEFQNSIQLATLSENVKREGSSVMVLTVGLTFDDVEKVARLIV
jgi:hypothetical protein